jgi:sugar phosphate isomerase/epimerase
MQFIMFTKHAQGFDLSKLVSALKGAGMDGADLCVRPGYPVTPENAAKQLPAAAKAFAEEGMSIPLVTTPGNFTEPDLPEAEPVFAACAKAGVGLIKLGYWQYSAGDDYWAMLDSCRKKLDGFAKLAEKHGPRALVHIHSGSTMGLNASAVMRLVEGFDSRYVGIFADPGHLAITGEPPAMAFNILRKYAACFAFKDTIKLPVQRDGRDVYVMHTRRIGDGIVDWRQVAKTIVDLKLDTLPISIHCEYEGEPAESVVDLARVDLRYVRRLFAEVGGK